METKYDKIGKGYDVTRVADPFITDRIYSLLNVSPAKSCLDVGCGTGNYLDALVRKGLKFHGVDPSELMLEKARSKKNDAIFLKATAEELPFENETFDGAMAIFTIHHWSNIGKGFEEIQRILKPNTNFVCLTFTTQQSKGYWLNHYFTKMMENTFDITPGIDEMQALLSNSGFKDIQFEKYFVKDDLKDHFLYSSKHKPERYLIPEIRNNTSAFSYYAQDKQEIQIGLEQLEEDINSGAIWNIIRSYENDHGDYLFVKAMK